MKIALGAMLTCLVWAGMAHADTPDMQAARAALARAKASKLKCSADPCRQVKQTQIRKARWKVRWVSMPKAKRAELRGAWSAKRKGMSKAERRKARSRSAARTLHLQDLNEACDDAALAEQASTAGAELMSLDPPRAGQPTARRVGKLPIPAHLEILVHCKVMAYEIAVRMGVPESVARVEADRDHRRLLAYMVMTDSEFDRHLAGEITEDSMEFQLLAEWGHRKVDQMVANATDLDILPAAGAAAPTTPGNASGPGSAGTPAGQPGAERRSIVLQWFQADLRGDEQPMRSLR